MRLEHRLRRLESESLARRPRRPCRSCGTAPGEPERFVLAPMHLDPRPPLPGPDACPACGRRLVVRLGAIALDDPALHV